MYYGILFSGQGAQRSGMGVELMADSLFSRIVSWASDVCELDLLKIMKNEHNELNCQHRFKIVRNHRFKNVLFHRFKCCFVCCSV